MIGGRLPPDWERHVGAELRKTFARYVEDGFFDRFLSGANLLDVAWGRAPDARPVLPRAVAVDLAALAAKGGSLPFADRSQDAVLASHALQHVADHRAAIAEWFRVVRVGGHLIIAVPHQFLYERKLFPPSAFAPGHLRFYTAQSLLFEVEEALDPLSYRVRLLEDNDRGFDYESPPDAPAAGCYEIVLVIERIARPRYADALLSPPPRKFEPGRYAAQPSPRPGETEPVLAIEASAKLPERILVLKLDHRGDFLLAVPAMRALRAAFPAARIGLACGPWNVEEAGRLGLFDSVVGHAFFPEVVLRGSHLIGGDDALEAFRAAFAGQSFDLAIDLRVHRDTRPLLAVLDATLRAGLGTSAQFPFLDIALPLGNPTHENRALRRVMRADRFTATVGRHEGLVVLSETALHRRARGEVLVYGPYETLPAGYWEVEIGVEALKSGFEIGFDITAGSGTRMLGAGRVWAGGVAHPTVSVLLAEEEDNVEIRLLTSAAGTVPPFRFLGCQIARRGAIAGPHQEEMAFLLASLAALRLRHPYRVREAI